MFARFVKCLSYNLKLDAGARKYTDAGRPAWTGDSVGRRHIQANMANELVLASYCLISSTYAATRSDQTAASASSISPALATTKSKKLYHCAD